MYRSHKTGGHAVSKFRSSIEVKIALEHRKGSNIVAKFQRYYTVSKRKGVHETSLIKKIHEMHTPCRGWKRQVYIVRTD